MGKHSTDYDGCGIYALYNVIDAKIYIGQSRNIKKRFQSHRAAFAAKSNVNQMYKEPIEKFVFLVLYKCGKETFSKFNLVLEELYLHESLCQGFSVYNKMKHEPGSYFVSDLGNIFDVHQNMEGTFKDAFGRRLFRMHLTTQESRERDLKKYAC